MRVMEPTDARQAAVRQRTKAEHATCSRCGRYRRVDVRSDQGKALCAACSGPEPASRSCPSCGETVPGAGRGLCLTCSVTAAARKRATFLAAGLESEWIRVLWNSFCEELLLPPAKVNRASKTLTRAHEYFVLLERTFSHQRDLTGSSLHDRVDSSTHRSYLLAYRHLLGRLALSDVASERSAASERDRIAAIVERAEGTNHSELIAQYIEELTQSDLPLRTARLYVGVAEAFCAKARLRVDQPCSQDSLDEYVMYSPGSRASLARFVRFGVQRLGWKIKVPTKGSVVTQRAQAAGAMAKVRAALEKCGSRDVGTLGLLDVGRVLAAATGLKLKQLTGQVSATDLLKADGAVVLAHETTIRPGHPLHPYAVRWQELIALRERVRSA